MRAVAATAFLYFLAAFGAGFLLGPIRVLVLEPRLGAVAAVLIEAPLLLAVIVVAARVVPRLLGVPPRLGPLLSVGFGALALQQIADVTVGYALRGLGLKEQLARLATPEGAIYVALLLAFALMPALVNRRP